MLQMALPESCLGLKISRPSEVSGAQEGGLTVLWLLQAPCLDRGLPGENFLLVIAGLPMPIFGVTEMYVVGMMLPAAELKAGG